MEKDWWNNREENSHAWKVNVEEIKKRNYNLDIKNPRAAEKSQQYTSGELIKLLDASFAKSHELLQDLKKELA